MLLYMQALTEVTILDESGGILFQSKCNFVGFLSVNNYERIGFQIDQSLDIISDRYDLISMKQANQNRIYKTINAFAIIVAILSLGHLVLLNFGVGLAKQMDDIDQQFGDRHLSVWVNLPFWIVLGIFALIQFFSGLMIFFSNLRPNTTKTIYYCSIIGMMVTFSLGVYLTMQAQQYNAWTRTFPKDFDKLSKLMPTYYTFQVDATVTFLFSFTMMAFIFYHQLNKYLVLQKSEQVPTNNGDGKRGLYFCIALFHSLAQIGFIFNLYQYSAIQDTKDYSADDDVDVYAFYLGVAVVIELLAIALQIKHLSRPFLDKQQNIVLGILVALFQMGSFIILVIATSQFFVQIAVLGDDLYNIFKWELLGYGIVNLIAIAAQFPYLKLISTIQDQPIPRDTLLTNQEIAQQEQ